MKCFYLMMQFLCLMPMLQAQSKNIIGKWILDRVVYEDARRLEINNSQYSHGAVCVIGPGFMRVNEIKFDASIRLGKINTSYLSYNYQREGDYLVLWEDGSKKLSFYLQPAGFIKRYPEFAPAKTLINGDSVAIANAVSDFDFNNDLDLDEFIRKRMTERSSKSNKNLYFQASFILTKDNKVKNLQVLHSMSAEYDAEYLRALLSAEPYFSNNTGLDLLITKEQHYLMMYKELKDPEEKKLFDILYDADQYYEQNQFDKAVEAYNNISKLSIRNNRYKMTIKQAMIRLGISYLALGNNEQACATFRSLGDRTDFQLRHYINDFCEPAAETSQQQ